MISRRQVIGSGLLIAGAGPAIAADSSAPTLKNAFAFEARVLVASPLVVGASSHGLRRVVPITGGTFKGPRLSGRVLPGGADWQVVRPDGVLDIEARYTLETDDGVLIMATNKGVRHGPKDVIDKLSRGERVDASQYYFRTSAQFEVPSESKHAWLNRALFVGSGERQADAAVIRFYEVL